MTKDERARYEALFSAAEKARDALDSILDGAADIAPPLTLDQARKVASEAFYPLADALDAVRDARTG